jgi:hypothetical protein
MQEHPLAPRSGRMCSLIFAVALLFQGCSGPPLRPWHTETLNLEFTARKAEEVRNFDDYLRLEERLFAQLDEKVYAKTDDGPEYSLVRFSRGSIADPGEAHAELESQFRVAAGSACRRRAAAARHVGLAL